MAAGELRDGAIPAVTVGGDGTSISVASEGPGGRQVTKLFTFPKCLHPTDSQSIVFDLSGVKDLVDAAMEGYDAPRCCPCSRAVESGLVAPPPPPLPLCARRYAATVLAYGQTGSGKTFTMTGKEGGA